jgi:poly-beta-hydroxyalkanoate depolymerase
MMYQLYQAQADLLLPWRQFARFGADLASLADHTLCMPPALRPVAAGLAMFAESGLTHVRPAFGIVTTQAADRCVSVVEEAVDETPFCTLLRFTKQACTAQPRVLLVAPMS